MAGVIYTDTPTAATRDESWLARVFETTPRTARREWRSADMVAVTCHHAGEAHMAAGVDRLEAPATGDVSAVMFGQLFEQPQRRHDPEQAAAAIAGAYAAHGASGFRSINGGWVGAIWDRRRREARFVRDSVGSHAFYAAPLPGRIVFATDLRVFEMAGAAGGIDDEAVAQFLRFLYVPPPRTIYRGVIAVHAAHLLVIGRDIAQERWATPRFVETPMRDTPFSPAEIGAHVPAFEERLMAAVEECIPAAGTIALALSGGQDSATLAVALSRLCPDRVLAFTVGERDERMSEASHAALVCRSLGLAHRVYVPTDRDIAEGISAFGHASDQPMGDLAAFAYFLGMRQLPEDSVILDGSGNDDYFGVTGPGLRLRYKRRADLQRLIPAWAWPVVPRLMARGPAGFQVLSRHWARPIEESFVPWEGWSPAELAELFGRPISMSGTHLYEIMRRGRPDAWRALMTEAIGGIWEAQTGFAKGVHFAHTLGIGIRYPFIDERMASWVHQLPMEVKLDKQVLRAYMAKHLPAEIVDKPKSGFIFDLNRLFLNPEHRWADELNRAGRLDVLPGWSRRPIDRLLRAHAANPTDARWQHRLYALCLLAQVFQSSSSS
jgi:asparagine synthase (glutamine-hydrolysing)